MVVRADPLAPVDARGEGRAHRLEAGGKGQNVQLVPLPRGAIGGATIDPVSSVEFAAVSQAGVMSDSRNFLSPITTAPRTGPNNSRGPPI